MWVTKLLPVCKWRRGWSFSSAGLNVRGGPTNWSCQLHVHHFCFYMFTWAEHCGTSWCTQWDFHTWGLHKIHISYIHNITSRTLFHLTKILCLCIMWHVTVCLSSPDLSVKFIVISRSYCGGVPLGDIGTRRFCSPCYMMFSFGNAD